MLGGAASVKFQGDETQVHSRLLPVLLPLLRITATRIHSLLSLSRLFLSLALSSSLSLFQLGAVVQWNALADREELDAHVSIDCAVRLWSALLFAMRVLLIPYLLAVGCCKDTTALILD